MGTRHLIGVVLDGDFKVAQYGQWDGYPTGQGVDVLNFCKTADLDSFRDEVRKVRFTTEEDKDTIKARWAEVGADDSGWVTMAQSDKFYADPRFAPLSRDVSANVLSLIAEGKVEFLNDSRDFGKDSLFCEWAYVIDLDENVLECYKGFQKDTPTLGRWAGLRDDESDYAAVTLAAEFALDALPDEEAFYAALGEDEDD